MDATIGGEQGLAMFVHEPLDVAQLGRVEAVVRGERDGAQPELGLQVLALDVNMGRLVSFPAVKVETIRADAQDRGHDGILRGSIGVSNPETISNGSQFTERFISS